MRPKIKKRIIDQLHGLQKVLEEVGQLVVDEQAKTTPQLPTLIMRLNDPNEGLARCRSELESLKAKLEPKGGHSHLMERLAWPLKEGAARKILDYFAQFQHLLSLAMSVDQMVLTLAIYEDTNMAKQTRSGDHLRKIYAWLAAPDHQVNHATALRLREDATGSWFVQGQCFVEWKCAANSFLWLHGIPGAGKTILCSTAIEEITNHCHALGSSFTLAFFYFDFQNKDSRPHALLLSLIKQLSLNCPSPPDALVKLFSEHEEGLRSPSLEALMRTLKSIIQSFENVYIAFDALDECVDRHQLLMILGQMHYWGISTLHLLATSRRERDIEEELKPLVSHEVPMMESLVNADIHLHVTRTLVSDIKFQKCPEVLKERMKITLMRGAHGMFRWVVCQLDALRKCLSPAALERALKSLPRTLDETYNRILAEIDTDHRYDARRLLQWLAFSVREISLEEAVEVIATDPDAEDGPLFDPARRLWDHRDVLKICSSLVTISTPYSYIPDRKDGDDKLDVDIGQEWSNFADYSSLKLAHFSVREYLVSEYLCARDIRFSFYHFDKAIADIFIAKTCLAYLLQFDRLGWVDSSTTTTYPLAHYAAQNWMRHALSDSGGTSYALHKLTMALLNPDGAVYTNWLSIHNPDGNLRPGTPSAVKCSPLYYTALAGLEKTSHTLVSHGSDVNVQEGCFGNPLQAASSRGHLGMVRLLLECGAKVNMRGGHYGNALQAASALGHDVVVRLLLDRGADINVYEGEYGCEYGSALEAASSQGHDMIVRLLLERGADVNAQGGRYLNALQAASVRGHDGIVRLLLEQGGDVNAQGGEYGHPLQAASFEGHDVTVKLLLDRGADVNAKGGLYGNALQAASLRGNDATVRLLLNQGANVNLQGGEYGSALQAASLRGNDTTVRLLLNQGANVNLQGGKYGSALQAACFHGQDTTAQLLLDRGADPNIQGGEYGNPLYAACLRGKDASVQLLLDRGAIVNSKGGFHGYALQAASSCGHETIVRLLLDWGADVNAQGGYFGNALQAALSQCQGAIIPLLMDKGADVNARGDRPGTPVRGCHQKVTITPRSRRGLNPTTSQTPHSLDLEPSMRICSLLF